MADLIGTFEANPGEAAAHVSACQAILHRCREKGLVFQAVAAGNPRLLEALLELLMPADLAIRGMPNDDVRSAVCSAMVALSFQCKPMKASLLAAGYVQAVLRVIASSNCEEIVQEACLLIGNIAPSFGTNNLLARVCTLFDLMNFSARVLVFYKQTQ
jgi:hypothetical protein